MPYEDRDKTIRQEMGEMVWRRKGEEFIAKRRADAAPLLNPIFRAFWEATHGPEDPWPGLYDAIIWRFPSKNRMCRPEDP